jgi:hypothetical protein
LCEVGNNIEALVVSYKAVENEAVEMLGGRIDADARVEIDGRGFDEKIHCAGLARAAAVPATSGEKCAGEKQEEGNARGKTCVDAYRIQCAFGISKVAN